MLPLFACAFALAAAPDAELQQSVRRLVARLDQPAVADRDAAEKSLLELGPKILPLLPEPSPRASAETRERLARIRVALQRTRDEAFTKATQVTLEGKFLLSEIIDELLDQTGNQVVDYREQFGQEADDFEIELAIKNLPFWQAMQTILDKAELAIYPFGDQQAIALVKRAEDTGEPGSATAIDGAFRVQATRFVAERDLRNPTKHSLQLTLEVQWEPRLRPIALLQPMETFSAVDGRGNVVPVAVQEAQFESEINPGVMASELIVPLAPPPRTVEQIASIKGELTVLVPGGVESFCFADPASAKNAEQRRGGALVVVEQARKNNAIWEVRMRVRYDEAAGALESFRGWVFNNEAYLQTADGKQIKPAGMETTSQSENEVGMAYLFDLADGLAGKEFVYETPTVLLRLPVQYELKNLPLP